MNLGDFFRLRLRTGLRYTRRYLAMWGQSPPDRVPGEKELTARGIDYCVHCDGALFRNKAVAVEATGNGVPGQSLSAKDRGAEST